MFNNYAAAARPQHHHMTQIDRSVEKGARLLAETQQKANEPIAQAFVADLPGLGARLVLYSEELAWNTGLVHHRVAFSVNDKPFDVILETNSQPDWITTADARQAAARAVLEKVSGAVWDQIIQTGALR
ncbi:MAG TPA: hypothetical protein VL418_18330 [Devosiaceae bacterium]|nr:hypothetical protein [Devosiaceae bacterium]